MKDRVDTLIVVSNDKLLQIVPENTPLTDAFLVADDILRQGVVGISEIIVKPGLVNVDFADVRTIMGNAGTALMGIGQGKGKTRAVDAAHAAISSPLLDFPITKARGIVFNIVGGPDMTLQEINSAAEVIYENVDPDANIIFGALVDDKIATGEVSITVLATGFVTDFFDSEGNPSLNSKGASRTSVTSPPPATPAQALQPVATVGSSTAPRRQQLPLRSGDVVHRTSREEIVRESDNSFEENSQAAEAPVSRRAAPPRQTKRVSSRRVEEDSDEDEEEEESEDEYSDEEEEEEEEERPRKKSKRSSSSGKKKKRGGLFGFFRRLFGG